jgi:hypothetical protein
MFSENFDANVQSESQATEAKQSPEKNEERRAIFRGRIA